MSSLMITQDTLELARAASSILISAARKRLQNRDGTFDLVMTGGKTPKEFYQHLAKNHADAIPWSRVRFFWGDERFVPPDHPESNFGMAKESLLDPLGIREEQIFRFKPETGIPPQVANEYERVLRSAVGPSTREYLFDFVLLGLGEDGHAASLFPEISDEWKRRDREGSWACSLWVPHLNAYRLTLLPHVLLSCRDMLFLTSGTRKARILKNVLELPEGQYPAQIFRKKALWLADQTAASLLAQAA